MQLGVLQPFVEVGEAPQPDRERREEQQERDDGCGRRSVARAGGVALGTY